MRLQPLHMLSARSLIVHKRRLAGMQGNGIAVSFGEDNDRKAAEAWLYGAVLVDRSHWGRLRFAGEGRLEFLNSQSTQALTGLQPGQGATTVSCHVNSAHCAALSATAKENPRAGSCAGVCDGHSAHD